MNLVIELQFPWSEEGTREDEEAFAELVLKKISDGPLSPAGGQIASVRAIRGDMVLTRRVTGGHDPV